MELARSIPVEFWKTLCEMAPYLLLGFLAAGVLSVVVRPAVVERHLGGGGLWPVLKAAVFGVPLPRCACRGEPGSCITMCLQQLRVR